MIFLAEINIDSEEFLNLETNIKNAKIEVENIEDLNARIGSFGFTLLDKLLPEETFNGNCYRTLTKVKLSLVVLVERVNRIKKQLMEDSATFSNEYSDYDEICLMDNNSSTGVIYTDEQLDENIIFLDDKIEEQRKELEKWQDLREAIQYLITDGVIPSPYLVDPDIREMLGEYFGANFEAMLDDILNGKDIEAMLGEFEVSEFGFLESVKVYSPFYKSVTDPNNEIFYKAAFESWRNNFIVKHKWDPCDNHRYYDAWIDVTYEDVIEWINLRGQDKPVTECYAIRGLNSIDPEVEGVRNELELLYVEFVRTYNFLTYDFKEDPTLIYKEVQARVAEIESDLAMLIEVRYQQVQMQKELPYLQIYYSQEFRDYMYNVKSAERTSIYDTLSSYYPMDYILQMFPESYEIMLYCYKTGGMDAVKKYCDAIKDKINHAEGLKAAESFLASASDSTIKQFLKGSGDGFQSFFEGIYLVFCADGVKTANQYEQMYILAGISSTGAYEVGSSIGNMIPAMIIALAASKVSGPWVQKLAGYGSRALSSAGHKINNAYISGEDSISAWHYAIFSGLSETFIGSLIGNIPFLNASSKFALKEILSEGVEEFYQTFFDAGWRYYFLEETGIDMGDLVGDALKSFLYGMITSAILNGSKEVFNFAKPMVINGVKITGFEDLLNFYSVVSMEGVKIDPKNKILTVNHLYDLTLEIGADKFKTLFSEYTIVDYSGNVLYSPKTDWINKLERKIGVLGLNVDPSCTYLHKKSILLNKLAEMYSDLNFNQTFQQLKVTYGTDIFNIASDMYIEMVKKAKGSYFDYNGILLDDVRLNYDALEGKGAFDSLPLARKVELFTQEAKKLDNSIIEAYDNDHGVGSFKKLSPDAQYNVLTKGRKEALGGFTDRYATNLANTTINNLVKMEKDGKFLEGITAADVLLMIEDNIDPTQYLKPEVIAEWKSKIVKGSTAPPGMVYTYTFQSTNKGIFTYGGNFGLDGNFSITEEQYNFIMDEENGIFKDGKCINTAALTVITGGVPFETGDVVCIRQTVPLDAIKMPTGALSSAYKGDWCPGGYTSGGALEMITPKVTIDFNNATVKDDSIEVANNVNINGQTYRVVTEVSVFGTSQSNNDYSGTDIVNKGKGV